MKGGEIFPLTGGKSVTRSEDKTGHKVTLPAKIKFPFMGTIYEDLYVRFITLIFKDTVLPKLIPYPIFCYIISDHKTYT